MDERPQTPILNGLSPRVRGNLGLLDLLPVLDRSIPACTGEPRSKRGADPWPGVYPRVYGGTTWPGRT